MKVLYLGPDSPLIQWLRMRGEVIVHLETPLTTLALEYDFLISYNYQHILSPEILARFDPLKRINLHISFLPWNRGRDPNFWSWVDNTPKGVTIHCLDEGVDTGPILAQANVALVEAMTLRTSYERLHEKIQALFQEHWPIIREGDRYLLKPVPQRGEGSVHKRADRDALYGECFEDDTIYARPISEVLDWIGTIQISRQSNARWTEEMLRWQQDRR